MNLAGQRKPGRPFIVIPNDVVERMIEMDVLNMGPPAIVEMSGFSTLIVRDCRKGEEYQRLVQERRELVFEFLKTLRQHAGPED